MLFLYTHKVGYRLQENRPLAMTRVVYSYFNPYQNAMLQACLIIKTIMQIKTYINHEAKVALSLVNYKTFGWCRILLLSYGCNIFLL